MEYGAYTATFSKKLSNSYSFSGKSTYDSVFAAPARLRSSSFSSRKDDYREIFGASGASRGSSIPILEVPELNDKAVTDDTRRSKIDYSKIFGGFESSHVAVSYEELFAQPKRKEISPKKARKGATSSKQDPSSIGKETTVLAREASFPLFDGKKKINISYNKSSQGTKNDTNGTKHIAQVHAGPGYTCLVDEVTPSEMNKAGKSMDSVVNDTSVKVNLSVKIKESKHPHKSVTGQPHGQDKELSQGGVEVQNIFNNSKHTSIHLSSSAYENGHESLHTRSETISCNLDNHKGDFERTVANERGVSTRNASEGATGAFSPSCFDDFVDSNSEAAASVAALKKAIEEAQEKLKAAKESIRRKKEGSKDNFKMRFSDEFKADRKEGKTTKRTKEAKSQGFFYNIDSSVQLPAATAAQKMNAGLVTPEHGDEEIYFAADDGREMKNSKPTQIESSDEEVEWKEAQPFYELDCSGDHSATTLEREQESVMERNLDTTDINEWKEKKMETKDFQKSDDFDETSEEAKKYSGHEKEEGNINADEGAFGYQKIVHEMKFVEEIIGLEGRLEMSNKLGVEMSDQLGETEMKSKASIEKEDFEKKLSDYNGLVGNVNDDNGQIENVNIICNKEETKEVEVSNELEQCGGNMRELQELMEENKIARERKEEMVKNKVFCEVEELDFGKLQETIDKEKSCKPQEKDFRNIEINIEHERSVEYVNKEKEVYNLVDNNEVQEDKNREEGIYANFNHTSEQEIIQLMDDNCHDEEEIGLMLPKDFKSAGNQTIHEVKDDWLLGGETYQVKEVEEEQKETHESMEDERSKTKIIEMIRDEMDVSQEASKHVKNNDETDYLHEQNEEEEQKETHECIEDERSKTKIIEMIRDEMDVTQEASKHVKNNDEADYLHEQNEAEDIRESNEAGRCTDSDGIIKLIPDVSANKGLDDIVFSKPEENSGEPEIVLNTNDLGSKDTINMSGLTQNTLQSSAMNQMEDMIGTVEFDTTRANTGENSKMVGQYQDQCVEAAKITCNKEMHVDEPRSGFVEIDEVVQEAEVAVSEDLEEYNSDFSHEEKMDAKGSFAEEEIQLPSTSGQSITIKDQEMTSSQSIEQREENHQAHMMMKENRSSGTTQQIELENKRSRKIVEAKQREREKEKEKIAVERAIREARERAFADAQERAALERAATEARRRMMLDDQERLGKNMSQTNDKSLADKAAMEAKLKAERAAVERATAEARARALERAMSEKAAFEARNKFEKSVGEKSFDASRNNGTRQSYSFYDMYQRGSSHASNSRYVRSSHGDPNSADKSDGANGESAQRCKARSERHQRIAERAAKALAEKNMRDHLAQKEREERNRLAEALDADVKRWSSGKEGNLRALLSTLQYILGSDSGWQPIPLTDIVTATAVRKAYRKATLSVHPDKLQQRGASIQQKYTCEKVFDLLKDAWNRFSKEER